MEPSKDPSGARGAEGDPGPEREQARRCETCGRHDALDLGDRALCEACYEGCGSCCPEFGKDDLWPA